MHEVWNLEYANDAEDGERELFVAYRTVNVGLMFRGYGNRYWSDDLKK